MSDEITKVPDDEADGDEGTAVVVDGWPIARVPTSRARMAEAIRAG